MGTRRKVTQQNPVSVNQQAGTDPQEDPYRQEFLNYRHFLMENEYKAGNSLEQAILTLSGGALGLSIVFVKDFAPTPEATWVLGVAWVLFAITLLSALLAMYFSQKAFHRAVEHHDSSYQDSSVPPLQNRFSTITTRFNQASIVFFFAGIVFLCVFAWFNLP